MVRPLPTTDGDDAQALEKFCNHDQFTLQKKQKVITCSCRFLWDTNMVPSAKAAMYGCQSGYLPCFLLPYIPPNPSLQCNLPFPISCFLYPFLILST